MVYFTQVKAGSREEIACGRLFGRQKNRLAASDFSFQNNDLALDTSKAVFSENDFERGITLPTKITPLLAEEVGMHLGDGFLSKTKNEYRLKGSYIDERGFYDGFVKNTYKALFNLDVQIKDYAYSYGFEVCSKALSTFKTNVLNIPAGRKTAIRVPDKLKVNDGQVLAGLIRGYFDTDGCLSFVSKYGYKSYYPNISAASVSRLLISDVAGILSMLGLKPYVSFNGAYWSVQLYGYANFFRYKELVGWNSQKYLDKIAAWEKAYPQLNGVSGEGVSYGPVVSLS